MSHEEKVKTVFSSFTASGTLKSRESNTVEFKESFNKGNTAKYAKTMAAYANNRGGYILFGVKDNPRTVIGLSNNNFDNLNQEQFTEAINSLFSPAIEWECGIIVVDVPKKNENGEIITEQKKIGWIYSEEAEQKPIIAQKANESEKIASGDVYYRYRARTQKIKFAEMARIMLTIMSSLAQEESRSISENVRWGKQKSMQDGNASFGYRHFLGYRKGKDGRPEVVPEEAAIVRDIYRMFLDGMTIRNIAKELTERGIKTPGGKDVWSVSTIRSILSNEKYKGDALLQKTYTLDYLTKTVKKNKGEVKQYYVTNSHEAIIDEDVFNLVQVELQRRSSMRRGLRNNSPFCTKLVCGDCGSFYGHKIFHAKEKHSKDVWYCNRRYQGSNNCSTPILAEGDLIRYYLQALSEILADKDRYISACKAQMDEANALEKIRFKREKAEVALAKDMAKIQALVRENAYISQDQQVYRQRFEEMSEQIEKQKNTIAELQEQELRLVGVREKLYRFIEALESFDAEPTFDSVTWNALVERVLVNPKSLIFEFKNGEKIKITI